MTARNLNVTYTRSEGTMLPGYLPRTRFFGMDEDFNAPGVGFIAGRQYDLDDLYFRAANRGWYTDSSHYLQTPLSNLKTWNLGLRTELEPIRNFNIMLDAKKDVSEIREVFYRLPVDENTGFAEKGATVQPQNPINTGSFSVSTIIIKTMFGDSRANNGSKAFDEFIKNRQSILAELLSRPANQPRPDPGRRGI